MLCLHKTKQLDNKKLLPVNQMFLEDNTWCYTDRYMMDC